jgi:hypothetical protein
MEQKTLAVVFEYMRGGTNMGRIHLLDGGCMSYLAAAVRGAAGVEGFRV